MHEHHKNAFEHLEDEIEDACEYLKEADEMEAQGHHYLAHGLHQIAMDEYSHANFLRDYLMRRGVYHDHEHHAEVEAHWHRLRGRLGFES